MGGDDGLRPGCVFCGIVAGREPARVVDGDERTLAFLDINPVTRGHTLVVPRRHARDLLDADPDDVAAVAVAARRVARAVVGPLGADGFNLLQATGRAAFQSVFHLHVHVLPRYRHDGIVLPFERHRGEPAALDAAAATLREALADSSGASLEARAGGVGPAGPRP